MNTIKFNQREICEIVSEYYEKEGRVVRCAFYNQWFYEYVYEQLVNEDKLIVLYETIMVGNEQKVVTRYLPFAALKKMIRDSFADVNIDSDDLIVLGQRRRYKNIFNIACRFTGISYSYKVKTKPDGLKLVKSKEV